MLRNSFLTPQRATARLGFWRHSRTIQCSRGAVQTYPNDASPSGAHTSSAVEGGYIDVWEVDGDWTSDEAYVLRRDNWRVAKAKELKEQPVRPPTVVTAFPEHARGSVAKNGLVLVDKPPQWTAYECVKAIKFAYQAKSVGHFGSLDNTATGLVIVAMGAATKLGQAFEELSREYSGVIRLGTATDTSEASGKTVEQLPCSHITDEDLREAAKLFCGEIMQVPPPSSSFMVDGKPLHAYTKKGEVPDVPARPCYVNELTVWRDSPDSRDVKFKLICGRGVYIRSIAKDLGKAVGSCAHLAELRRLAIGDFRVEDAWTLDTLLPLIKKYAKAYRSG